MGHPLLDADTGFSGTQKMLVRHQKKYNSFKATRDAEYERRIATLGVTDRQVADAQIKLSRAEAKSDAAHAEAKNALGENMVDAVAARSEHQKVLRDRRIALELEAAPPKNRDPKKKTMMQRMMEASEKAEARQNAHVRPGTRDQSKQPRNLTKAQRKEQAKRREERRQDAKSAKLSPEELERRRQERKRQARENRKNKRK
ncbi:hypothetical protein [Nanchangia anserum]|uniref:hypothetical protein n=1 Tax=Nanchangia anserum TaxID=2692125 RepID=UPI001D10244B|nr:hypothetical protein [Nanchangia anserum]